MQIVFGELPIKIQGHYGSGSQKKIGKIDLDKDGQYTIQFKDGSAMRWGIVEGGWGVVSTTPPVQPARPHYRR